MDSLKKILVLIILIAAIVFYQTAVAQEKKEQPGKIEQFEKELEKTKEDTSKNRSAQHEDSDEEGSSFWGSLIGELIVKPVLFGVFIGSSDDDSPYSVNLWNSYFSDYPYQAPNVGLYSSPEQTNKSFSMKLFGNYFYNSADLQGFDFRARICPLPFLGAALDFTDLNEALGSKQDHIQIYNIFVNYYRGRSQHLALWWGLGVKGIAGDRTRHSFAVNIGTEIYPVKPVSCHFNYNIGSINEKAVGELLLHLNYHIQRSIVFIGYHRYSVGSAVLDGAIAGVGVYL